MDGHEDLSDQDDVEGLHGDAAADEDDIEDIDRIDDDEDFERGVARRRPGADVEQLLNEILDMVDQARPAPLSAAVKIDRDELMDLVEQALDRLPEELRSARWLLKEREQFLDRTHREADEILAAARGQSERMVQRSEVMRSAEAKARRIVDESRAEAARIRNQCDDYCDQRLAQLEAVLERTLTVVAAGRKKLRPSVESSTPTGFVGVDPHEDTVVSGLHSDDDPVGLEVKMFDQDRV